MAVVLCSFEQYVVANGSGDYSPTSDLEITELPDAAVGQEAQGCCSRD